jgi:uncharacterized protein
MTNTTTEKPYRTALETYIATHAKPTHKFGHQPRLYALTQQIGQGLTYDDDVVFAAVWLHDLGVFVGHRPEDEAALKTWDHVAYVTEKAPSLLTEFCFPEDKIPAVLEVIRTHQPHDKPLTIEATIARDADILEQLGAIGITRTLAKLGSDTRFETFTEAHTALKLSRCPRSRSRSKSLLIENGRCKAKLACNDLCER